MSEFKKAISKNEFENFKRNAEKWKNEARQAEEYVRDLASGIYKEGWHTFKREVCYKTYPIPIQAGIFCIGFSRDNNGQRVGYIGCALETLEGFYTSAFPCPYYDREDCPLRRRQEEKAKEKEDLSF